MSAIPVRRPVRVPQRGLSLVELLVAVAVTLVVVAGALKMLASHIDSNRRLLLEARVHQDLRAASDWIARDLRRAGYWQSALQATSSPARANPYRLVTPRGAASSASTTYSYSRDAVENDSLDLNETLGLRLNAGALQMLDGGGWQQMTDPATVLVTRLAVTPRTELVSLGHLCTPRCSSSDPACPAMSIRHYEVAIQGRSAVDASVTREVRESVRVRNDDVFPVGCPS